MDADDDLSPPDAELDEYGVPVQPLPEWPIRDFLVAVCCLACANVPPLMLFGYIGKYSHLRLSSYAWRPWQAGWLSSFPGSC